MEEITSLQNARVKRIVKLQRKASFRRAERLTVIEGAREVRRAVENGWQPVECWVSNDWVADPEKAQGLESFKGAGTSCFQCSENVFEKITYRDNPDGILAVGPLIGRGIDELELPDHPLILIAEGVEKPGNLGALLRTADGVGADAVIVADPATDLNNPNVIRNSIGTLFYLPIAEATTGETIAFLKEKGMRTLTAVPDAAAEYTDCDLTGPLAIVVGAEDRGLTDPWKRAADLNVSIPMCGKNDSLNVSVSAAVLLYEALRQRRKLSRS